MTGSLETSYSKAQRMTPSKTPQRTAEGRVEKSVKTINHMVLSKHLLKAVENSSKYDSAVKGGIDLGNPGPSKKPCSPSSSKARVDSPVVSAPAKATNNFSLSDKQLRFLASKAARRTLASWEHAGSVFQDQSKGSGEVSPERLREWRKAPERLNEAEKDALQRAIQAAHQRDLEEMEKDQEVDESMLVEGGDDSQESDF